MRRPRVCWDKTASSSIFGVQSLQGGNQSEDYAGQDGDAEGIPAVWQIPDRFWPLLANGSPYVARTSAGAGETTGHVRKAAQGAARSAVLYDIRPMEEIVSRSIASQRLATWLLGVFAVLALVLSAVGIYGVISYLTGQRTHEIGVRVALGASRRDVLRLVLGQGLKITLIGVGIGVIAALGLTRLITTMIYGVGAMDPLTFAAVAVLLSGIALAACYLPARRIGVRSSASRPKGPWEESCASSSFRCKSPWTVSSPARKGSSTG